MYAPIQSAFDRELVISNAQVLDSSSHVAGTNEIDLGSANMGKGEPVKLILDVTAEVGNITVLVCSKATASVAYSDKAFTLPVITAAGQYSFTLPQDVLRYVNLFYSAGTSGTVTAWLTADPN